jgi:LysM repeat protein
MVRRRLILGGLSGLLAAAVLAGAASGLVEDWWAAVSMGVLVSIYLGLLVRHRPRGPEPTTGEWASPYLLDRWAVTRFLWAGLAGCVFKLVVVLIERLTRDGQPAGGLRGAVLERGVRLHGHLARRALWSLAASATTAATVTAGTSLMTSQVASATPALSSQATSSTSTYLVQPGDTLSGIADQFGTTVTALAAANNIADPDLIYAGQTLTIVGATTSYLVQPGDTLSGIADQFGTTVAALAAANNIADPDLIYAGQTLSIVGPSTSVASATSATISTTSGVLDPSQIAQLLANVGFQGASIWEFTAIALAESMGDPSAVSPVTAVGTQDFGLFQIDSSSLGAVPNGDWANPVDNSEGAFAISGGGANPYIWCTWPGGCGGTGSGAAAQYFSVAQAAAAPFDGDQ